MEKNVFDTKEAAEYIGMSFSYLAKARSYKDPSTPVYVCLGRSVKYLKKDLDNWLKSKRVKNGARQ